MVVPPSQVATVWPTAQLSLQPASIEQVQIESPLQFTVQSPLVQVTWQTLVPVQSSVELGARLMLQLLPPPQVTPESTPVVRLQFD